VICAQFDAARTIGVGRRFASWMRNPLASMLTRHDPELRREPVRHPADMRPNLFVVIDTEEEFDWSAPFSRTNQRVTAMRHVARAQRLFERHGIAPIFVVDYPVASQRDGYAPLKELAAGDACVIGAHLHPWVNPPFTEPVNRHNSYGCNLTPALEAAKLRVLAAEIADRIGVAPRIFKAGRYGVGRSTLRTLDELEFDIDTSINPSMDYSEDGGPSFQDFDASPFFFGRGRRLLEIPCTTGFVGACARAGRLIDRVATTTVGRAAHLGGIAARLHVSERLHLSPEHSTLAEMRRLTHALLARGIRTFTLTFHSPSLAPGHTPYVRTARDLDRFLACLDAYCGFFRGVLGGTAMRPHEFRALIRRQSDEGARHIAA
jgi:hypothetical protein